MTTKTEAKGAREAKPSQEMLRSAYEVHTLAQMLYGQLAATYPHTPPVSFQGFTPWAATPPVMPPMQGQMPHPGVQPTPWMGMTYPVGHPMQSAMPCTPPCGVHPFFGTMILPR